MNLTMAGIITIVERLPEEHFYVFILDADTDTRIAKIAHGVKEVQNIVHTALDEILSKSLSPPADTGDIPKTAEDWIQYWNKKGNA